MPYVYWEHSAKPRVFHTVKTQAELRKVRAWGLAEGSTRVVGSRTYMHLPDKPLLALGGADSVLQPATTPACQQSDIAF